MKKNKQAILLCLLLLITSTQLTHNQSNQSNPLKSLAKQNPTQQQSPLLPPPSHHPPPSPSPIKSIRNNTRNHHFFSAQNSFWSISFKVLKTTFRWIVISLYYPLAFLFNLVNLLILWVWDQFIFPMTFPIRVSCWIFIIKPIQIVKKLLKKLKPFFLFVISAITFGALKGIMGGLVYIFIANRLFPLHLKAKITLNKPLQNLDLLKKKTIDNHLHPSVGKYHQDEEDQFGIPLEKLNKKKNQDRKIKKSIQGIKVTETKRKSRKQKETDSELSSLEEEDLIDEEWPLSEEGKLKDFIERNKYGSSYSSAIQSIIHDPTRKRSSSNFNLQFHSDTPPISNLHLRSHLNQPSSSSPSSNLKKNSPFETSSNNKKVTFKID